MTEFPLWQIQGCSYSEKKQSVIWALPLLKKLWFGRSRTRFYTSDTQDLMDRIKNLLGGSQSTSLFSRYRNTYPSDVGLYLTHFNLWYVVCPNMTVLVEQNNLWWWRDAQIFAESNVLKQWRGIRGWNQPAHVQESSRTHEWRSAESQGIWEVELHYNCRSAELALAHKQVLWSASLEDQNPNSVSCEVSCSPEYVRSARSNIQSRGAESSRTKELNIVNWERMLFG